MRDVRKCRADTQGRRRRSCPRRVPWANRNRARRQNVPTATRQGDAVAKRAALRRPAADRDRVRGPRCANPCGEAARRTDAGGTGSRVCDGRQVRIYTKHRRGRRRRYRVLRRNRDRTRGCCAATATRQWDTIAEYTAFHRRTADRDRV